MPEKEALKHPVYSAVVQRASARYLESQRKADEWERKFAGGAPIGFDTATTIRRKTEKRLKKVLPGSTSRLRYAVISEAQRKRGDFKRPLFKGNRNSGSLNNLKRMK